MVIDEDCPGGIRVSDTAYDKRVAGIVSGAGDLRPGLTLSQDDSCKGGVHVALSGRVYCKGDATSAPIEPGDLLTTSDVRGHAQKAEDIRAAQGAILGKAMSHLAAGRGLVMVLVSLQ
jgi:hypothetical protein